VINQDTIVMKPALQLLLTELSTMNPQIRLSLPASPRRIQAQVQQLSQLEQRLQLLHDTEIAKLHRSLLPSVRQRAQAIAKLVVTMLQDIRSLKLLAEEYPLDPDGTIACWQDAYAIVPDLQSRLNQVFAQDHRA
jgi:hypothetical protein